MHAPDQYLKDLLYEYDCVTIPGFGGFIMQLQQARVDQSRQRIYPPSRQPSFNSLLMHDDGLLISRMARSAELSYHDASRQVAEFISDMNKRLELKESIVLKGIGQLEKGPEGAIVFRPDAKANFLPSTYGMVAMNLYPVSKRTEKTITQKKHADRTSRDFRGKKPASVKWTMALTLPVILFLLYGIIFPSSIQKMYTNYSGMIPEIFQANQPEPVARQAVPEVKLIQEKENVIIEPPEPPVIINKTEQIAEKPTTELSPASVKYYIIGGCFEKEENAEKFLVALNKKGFEAEKAGVTKRGHVRISYKSFNDKEPALSYLQKIKEEENPAAWLLKY